MLKSIQFLQDFTKRITNQPAVDIWAYAEPAGFEPNPLKRNVLQWRRVISSVRDPLAEFPGQAVDVTGFVQRSPNGSPELFNLARPVIRCCLADTVPLGLSVYTPDASRFPADTWLRVQGTFAVQMIHHKPTLVIMPTKLKPIREPKKRYINGVF